MRKTYKSYEKEIFRKLYENKETDIYYFFEHYKLSPGHIAKFIINCKDKGLVKYEEGIISITKKGEAYIEENREKIYLEKAAYWRKIPDKMRMLDKPTILEILDLSKNDEHSFRKYKR